MRFREESVFRLEQVVHCTTKQTYKIESNMCCSPDSRPGLLLGLVKVNFSAVPNKCDEYPNEILIDVGLAKCLSIPIELKIVTPKLYKLNKCLQSGKLLLGIESIFANSKLELKELFTSSITSEDKVLIKKYTDQLKQTELYSSNCATLLESTDKNMYYEKLSMLLYLEGDHRKRLLQRCAWACVCVHVCVCVCMCVCARVHVYTYIHMYVYVYVRIYVYVCVGVCLHVCEYMCVRAYVHTYVCVCVCVCVRVCICMCVCISYMCACVCARTYIRMYVYMCMYMCM